MTRRVLLVEVGTAAELPVVTPPAPRPPAAWVPNPRPTPGLLPPTGLSVQAAADAAVATWTRSAQPGTTTVIETAPDVSGQPGIWRELARTGDETYTVGLPGGAVWIRVHAALNGRTSVATAAVLADPVRVGESISELEQDLRDINDQVVIVAAQAAAEAAALNIRADELRTDVDNAIAEVSTLADTTDTMGTELTRVETESISRDTAATATVALLGAKNAQGTAFVLDADTTRVSPTESLAQWRNSLVGEFAGQSSRIDSEEQARQTADIALTSAVQAAQSTANNAATKAELTSAQSTLAAANQATASRVDITEAAMRGTTTVVNPGFEDGDIGWSSRSDGASGLPDGVSISTNAVNAYSGSRYLAINSSTGGGRAIYNRAKFAAEPNEVIRLRMQTRTSGAPNVGATIRIGIREEMADGSTVNRYVPFKVSTGSTWLYPDGVIEGTVTLSAAAAFAQALIYTQDLTTGIILCDAVAVSRSTLYDENTLARITTVENASVARDAAAADRLNLMEVRMPSGTGGLATADSLSATNLTVAQQGGELTSQGQQLTGLTASVGGAEASINELREVAVAASAAGVVINPSFEANAPGTQPSGWGTLPANCYVFAYVSSRSGANVLRFDGSSTADRIVSGRSRTPVTTGQLVRPGFWLRYGGSGAANPEARFSVMMRGYDASGTYVPGSAVTLATIAGPEITNVYAQLVGSYTVPAQVVSVQCDIRARDHTSGSVMIDDVFVDAPSNTLADVLARYSLSVTAGGDIAGMQLLAGGGISAIRMLANIFEVVDPSGLTGYTHSNGISIWRKGGHMTVIGPGFGAGNEFTYWFGPNQTNLNNCTRATGIRWDTVTGLSYALGAMFSGTITAGGYTTSLSATSYSTGAFGTNGGPIVVNASFTQSRRQMGGRLGNTKNTIAAGSGVTRSRIELWRSVGGGAPQLVTSTERAGVMNITNYTDPDLESFVDWNNTVSLTHIDNAGGSAARNFEVRLIESVFQNVTITGGAPVPPPTNNRSLGVSTSE